MTYQEFHEQLKKEKINEDALQALLVNELTKKGLRVAAAESCTGGMVSMRITAVPGSSGVFDCGVCSYSNAIKEKVLGVPHKTLAAFGAVSQQTAEQMAQGVKALAGADIAVSATGIAGPDGGTAQKPVGLVYIGCCTGMGVTAVKAQLDDFGRNDRQEIRKAASSIALYLALKAAQQGG